MNYTTGQQGTFPVGCTLPRAPTRIVLFNCSDLTSDIMGRSIIEGAQLSYPTLLDVHRFNSQTLTSDRVVQLLDDDRNFQIIVCGPVGMNARVVDMISELGGSWSSNMRILTSDRPN
jgi:NAD(P)H-flavin reductase